VNPPLTIAGAVLAAFEAPGTDEDEEVTRVISPGHLERLREACRWANLELDAAS